MTEKELIYEYRRMPLRVVPELHSFSRRVVFGLFLGAWPIWSQVLGYWSSVGMGSSHGVGPKFSQILVGYSHKHCATVASFFLILKHFIITLININLTPFTICLSLVQLKE